MLLDYTKTNVLTLPITNKLKAIEKSIVLSPGINEMSKDDWTRCESLPKVKRLVEGKQLIVVVKDDDTENDFAIAKASISEADKIIKRTWNIILLEDWKAGENRAGVVKAINLQLKVIEKRTAPKEKAANA